MPKKIDRNMAYYIIKRIILTFGFLLLQAVILFAFAGGLDVPSALFFFGLSFLYNCLNTALFLRYCPELLAERGEIKPSFRIWDATFWTIYFLTALALFAVAGLELGSLPPGQVSLGLMFFGTVLFVFAGILSTWAMLENKFFELTIHIQKERHQYVVATGPYAIIRHPIYASIVFTCIAEPLMLGSLYALACSAIILVLFVIRTVIEDGILQKDLKGYKAYAKKVKYRFIPSVW
jgi:protein-S-isoprenylcysteine O-methyltransferase Ste14